MGFSDLLSSSKGPGVIGTLIALLVLGGFGTLYLFVFDADMQGGGKKIEAVIRDQASEIESLKGQSVSRRKQIEDSQAFLKQADEIQQLERRVETTSKQLAEAQEAKAAAEQAIEPAAKKSDDYKQAYRDSEWAAAKGESLGDLTTQDGKVYHKVVIREITAKGISIGHESGQTRVDAMTLPKALYDRFQFDVEQKKKADVMENVGFANHADSVAYALKNEQFAKNAATIDKLDDEIASGRNAIRQAQESIPRRELDLQSQRNAIAVEKTKKLSRAPAMETKLKNDEATLEQTKRRIPEMEREVRNKETEIARLNAENAQLKKDVAKIIADNKAANAAAGNDPTKPKAQ